MPRRIRRFHPGRFWPAPGHSAGASGGRLGAGSKGGLGAVLRLRLEGWENFSPTWLRQRRPVESPDLAPPGGHSPAPAGPTGKAPAGPARPIGPRRHATVFNARQRLGAGSRFDLGRTFSPGAAATSENAAVPPDGRRPLSGKSLAHAAPPGREQDAGLAPGSMIAPESSPPSGPDAEGSRTPARGRVARTFRQPLGSPRQEALGSKTFFRWAATALSRRHRTSTIHRPLTAHSAHRTAGAPGEMPGPSGPALWTGQPAGAPALAEPGRRLRPALLGGQDRPDAAPFHPPAGSSSVSNPAEAGTLSSPAGPSPLDRRPAGAKGRTGVLHRVRRLVLETRRLALAQPGEAGKIDLGPTQQPAAASGDNAAHPPGPHAAAITPERLQPPGRAPEEKLGSLGLAPAPKLAATPLLRRPMGTLRKAPGALLRGSLHTRATLRRKASSVLRRLHTPATGGRMGAGAARPTLRLDAALRGSTPDEAGPRPNPVPLEGPDTSFLRAPLPVAGSPSGYPGQPIGRESGISPAPERATNAPEGSEAPARVGGTPVLRRAGRWASRAKRLVARRSGEVRGPRTQGAAQAPREDVRGLAGRAPGAGKAIRPLISRRAGSLSSLKRAPSALRRGAFKSGATLRWTASDLLSRFQTLPSHRPLNSGSAQRAAGAQPGTPEPGQDGGSGLAVWLGYSADAPAQGETGRRLRPVSQISQEWPAAAPIRPLAGAPAGPVSPPARRPYTPPTVPGAGESAVMRRQAGPGNRGTALLRLAQRLTFRARRPVFREPAGGGEAGQSPREQMAAGGPAGLTPDPSPMRGLAFSPLTPPARLLSTGQGDGAPRPPASLMRETGDSTGSGAASFGVSGEPVPPHSYSPRTGERDTETPHRGLFRRTKGDGPEAEATPSSSGHRPPPDRAEGLEKPGLFLMRERLQRSWGPRPARTGRELTSLKDFPKSGSTIVRAAARDASTAETGLRLALGGGDSPADTGAPDQVNNRGRQPHEVLARWSAEDGEAGLPLAPAVRYQTPGPARKEPAPVPPAGVDGPSAGAGDLRPRSGLLPPARIVERKPAYGPPAVGGPGGLQPAALFPASTSSAAGSAAPASEAETQVERQFEAWEIEFLASKVYSYLRDKLAVEKERHGRPGFPLWP